MPDEFVVTEELQAKVLAYMVADPEFSSVASAHLSEELFSNKALQWFYTKISSSEIHLTKDTLKEEMIRAAKNKQIRKEEVSKYIGLYDIVKNDPLPAEKKYLQEELSTFIKTQAVKRAFEDGFQMAKEQQWEDLLRSMEEAVHSGMHLNDLGTDYFAEVEDRVKTRASREKQRRIPTGIDDLDQMTYGGIKNKQVGLIVGGTGRGKSIFLAWLAQQAVLLNKKVVYITCELSEEDISDRFDSMMAQVHISSLNDYQEEIVNKVGGAAQVYGSSLMIKHFPADSATVDDLKAYTRQLSNIGIQPDLILIDYLDLLRPHRTYSSPHLEIDAIMKALVGFAAEFDLSIYTATQLNRAGLAQETPDEASMAGYIGKQYHADMVWWMAQTKEEKEDEIMRLWISKNRNGPAGRTIKLDTNYGYMTFYRKRVEVEGDEEEEVSEAVVAESGATDMSDKLQFALAEDQRGEDE